MNTWRARITVNRTLPTITVGGEAYPGETVLAGAESWAAAFRAAGLRPGDRLVTALPTGICLAQVLVAGLWERLTLVPMAPSTDPVVAAAGADPVAAVAAPDAFGGRDVGWAWRAEGMNGPGPAPTALRPAGPSTPAARLLCAAGGAGAWAALLDDNLEHAVDAVLAALQPERARWLSVLAWHEPAGLLLDLLPALVSADSILRPGQGDQLTTSQIADAVSRWQPTHTVMPLGLVRDLSAIWNGLDALGCIVNGLASGPGVDLSLARELAKTRLRTHRGAPELSCMVTLGEPGVWRSGALGRPVDCVIADGPGGRLLVSGRPVAGGSWLDGALQLVDRRTPVAVAFA